MNKKEFVETLAKRTDMSQAKAGEALNAVFGCESGVGIIADELASGGSVTIPGFGTFSKKHRAQRSGINPATKEKITIKAKDYPAFKAGKTLKDRVG